VTHPIHVLPLIWPEHVDNAAGRLTVPVGPGENAAHGAQPPVLAVPAPVLAPHHARAFEAPEGLQLCGSLPRPHLWFRENVLDCKFGGTAGFF
jgi:hypothetical protein